MDPFAAKSTNVFCKKLASLTLQAMRTEGAHGLYEPDFAQLVAEAAPNTADPKAQDRAKGKTARPKVPAVGAPAQIQHTEKLKEIMAKCNKAGSTTTADLAASLNVTEANAEDAGHEEEPAGWE